MDPTVVFARMGVILHLVDDATWQSVPRDQPWAPPSLADEGFVHCSGDDAVMLEVANRFYRSVPGTLLVLSLDLDRLAASAEVRWEAPAPPDRSAPTAGEGTDEPLFPHVYGPLDPRAVVAVRRLVRDGDGVFVGYERVASD
jgi:uncharacterized protein (DUF952 family)